MTKGLCQAPGPTQAGDEPLALHSPLPAPLDFGPVSGSGTCFHSNRSCRQGPAHRGMKSWSCGLVWRIGTVGSATPHLRPSGGQAPRLAKSSTALHFPIRAPLEGGNPRTNPARQHANRKLGDNLPRGGEGGM